MVGGETVQAFVPHALPPEPPLVLQGPIQLLLERALLSLGRLDSVSTPLPDPSLFLYAYVRKEAVLSSQIEGTQSSLSDLLFFELERAPGAPTDDVAYLSIPAAAAGMDLLVERGIGRELTGRKRNRVYACDRYLAVLGEGT